jgi:hypothetical protein
VGGYAGEMNKNRYAATFLFSFVVIDPVVIAVIFFEIACLEHQRMSLAGMDVRTCDASLQLAWSPLSIVQR